MQDLKNIINRLDLLYKDLKDITLIIKNEEYTEQHKLNVIEKRIENILGE
jgi:hypothetical protein